MTEPREQATLSCPTNHSIFRNMCDASGKEVLGIEKSEKGMVAFMTLDVFRSSTKQHLTFGRFVGHDSEHVMRTKKLACLDVTGYPR